MEWIDGYIGAWISNDPDDISRLFAEDDRYFTSPYVEPWVSRQEIISGWLERKDEPGIVEFNEWWMKKK